ncbi:3-isopropylmalate dehydratase large subunit [Polaromonas sp.]|uniref:3-isopropylmalate dehydratase large subunit n=1 Tax=Polaromonas sp. TaxID=1869339 RepID=UPI0032635B77
MTQPRTLFDKLWDAHIVAELAPGTALLHVDRHFIHDLQSSVFASLADRKLAVRSPELTVCVADHGVSSLPTRTGGELPAMSRHLIRMREGSRAGGIAFIDANDHEQGIIHVIGPELGLTLPGMLIACGDSHTSTHGAFGALALGIGTTEIVHVLATQTVCVRKPHSLRITLVGELQAGVESKDVILALVHRVGTAGATGHAIEYAGSAVRAMDMEARMTLCNLSIEMGANFGMIAPDETTFAFLKRTPNASRVEWWEQAIEEWHGLVTDDDAVFDREVTLDASTVQPQISWGTSPEQTMGLDDLLPQPELMASAQREAMSAALNYMGLAAGAPLAGTPVDHVFIGSCANGRLSDLRRAANVVRDRQIARGTAAWVVPGSQAVRRAAEAEGLDAVFRAAGFEWRAPGCSMCVGVNGDILQPGQRCVSTSNRNFVGRQGPGVRTHLAGARVAAATALLGHIPGTSELLKMEL